MKILFATPYIYDKRYVEFTKNSTGFGIMVNDIYNAVSDGNEVYLYSHVYTKGHDGIIKHSIAKSFIDAKFRDYYQAIKWFFKYKQNLKSRLRYACYCINKGEFRNAIHRLKPDIVHIHGIGLTTKVFIEVCEEMNIPYIVTLHGLIGMNDSVTAESWNKEYEKDFLIDSEKRNIPVSVISTGIKRRIEANYLRTESHSIEVITNGTHISKVNGNPMNNYRKKYMIPDCAKIAIVVGNICPRKNQIQVVEAIYNLPVQKRENLFVFMCGTDFTNGEVLSRIVELGLEKKIIMLGFVPREQMADVYRQADINIVASVDEGFGLSIIEAYKYGIPTVTFSDLDAVEDLYHENAMIKCEKRNSQCLADGINFAMEKKWDSEFIVFLSEEFSMMKMAEKYLRQYDAVLKLRG